MDWINYQPPGEEQHSGVLDTWGCTSFSAVHCIESQEIRKFGKTKEYSERALAKLAGTVPGKGSGVPAVADAIAKYGLILEKDWPSVGWTTLDEFDAEIPQEVLNKAVKIDFELRTKNLNFEDAPYWTEMMLPSGIEHMVEQLNPTQYFDSYEQYLKPLDINKVNWQGQLIFKGYKNMNETKIVLSKDGQTVYKATPVATDWDNFVKQCGVEGINIPNPIPPSSSL